jgi:hypothetical protein
MTARALRSRSILAAFAVLSGALAPSPALACWDGFYARVGDVEEMGSDDTWDADDARERARWLGRIDALLPSGAMVLSEWGTVTVSVAGHEEVIEWRDGHYLTLFREVARVGASPAEVARARGLETPVYVVQVGASSDRNGADAFAARVSSRDEAVHGFLEAGGFPADNAEAHVVTITSAREIHRVYVRAFVDRGEAQALVAALGGHAFVRAL